MRAGIACRIFEAAPELKAVGVGINILPHASRELCAVVDAARFSQAIIAEAVEAPVSIGGIIYMALLAYLIFTIVMTLQRKEAAWSLAVGLATLGLTLIFLAPEGATVLVLVAPLRWPAFIIAIVCLVLLRRPASRAWFSEP